MFSAYFDESGFHDNPPIQLIAGFVLKSQSAVRLTKKWNRLLAKNGIEVFHGKSFNGGHGDYAGWPRDKYNAFVLSLATAVNERVEVFISHAIEPRHFNAIRPNFPKVNKSPYQLLFQDCLTGLSHWAMKSPTRRNISIYYEMGNNPFSKAVQTYANATENDTMREKFRIISIKGLTKKEPLLQAAHLFAYHCYTEQKAILKGSISPNHESLDALIIGKKRVGGRHTLETVKNHFNRDQHLFS